MEVIYCGTTETIFQEFSSYAHNVFLCGLFLAVTCKQPLFLLALDYCQQKKTFTRKNRSHFKIASLGIRY